jgi:hypothetical protein
MRGGIHRTPTRKKKAANKTTCEQIPALGEEKKKKFHFSLSPPHAAPLFLN